MAPLSVGERLRMLRLRAGLTQVQLGRSLGIAGPTISGYESGASYIKADELPRFAAVLGAQPSEFFDEPSGTGTSGDDLAEEFKAFIATKVDRLPPHEQRAVYLAAGIVDTFLSRAG